MLKTLLLALLIATLNANEEYSQLVIHDGESGDWRPEVRFDTGYFACGVELRYEKKQGWWGDDTATNGWRLTLCRMGAWQDQRTVTAEAGNWGTWRGVRVCPAITYVIAAQAKYELLKDSNDDHTANNGLRVRCGDPQTGHVA